VFQVSSLKVSNLTCYFTVGAVSVGTIEHALKRLGGSGKKALRIGKGWLLLEETPPNTDESQGVSSRLSATSLTTSQNAGISSTLYEGTSNTTYPKYVCLRPYDPTGSTRYAYGIVTWNKDNPAKNGYSIKDENYNAEFARGLRCPKSANQSEYKVDGVYNILWDMLYGARALKIPNNCTATLNVDSLNLSSA
jgi:hypothetical protein